MSGTSLDGVDAALIHTDGETRCQQLASFHLPYPIDFQTKLKALIDNKCDWCDLEYELTLYHVKSVQYLLHDQQIDSSQVTIIGFHGQTIYHNPENYVTWQIGNPHILAQRTKINVVSDFRRRDVACSGNGAPLVPIFHQCLMQDEVKPVAILNIGGVANITYLDDNLLLAFDTGPGNALINDAMLKYYGKVFDDNGLTARQGSVQQHVVEHMLQDRFFSKEPPKSLDRNHFVQYEPIFTNELNSKDIIATLTEFTVSSIVTAINSLPNTPKKIFVCGGGAKNGKIMERLNMAQNSSIFCNIGSKGVDPDFVEAQAFAYLAVRYLKHLPSTFPQTTSVNQEKLSGVLFLL